MKRIKLKIYELDRIVKKAIEIRKLSDEMSDIIELQLWEKTDNPLKSDEVMAWLLSNDTAWNHMIIFKNLKK